VAVCPERGSSIDVAGVTVPTRNTEAAVPRKAASATARLKMIQATNNRRDRFMASSLKNKTYPRIKR
jgi:hypothetical protein